MMRWLTLLAISGLCGCTVGGGGGAFEEAACTDAGECFDARVDEADVLREPGDAQIDAAPDAMPREMDATGPADATPDAMRDAMSREMDAALDAMHAIDARVDGMLATDAQPDIRFIPHDADPVDALPDADLPPGPVARCDEIDSVECFGHPDCPDGQRCQDLGEAGVVVPCCVRGRRGDIEPGGSCADVDGQIECQSGVCIEDVGGDDLCSGACDGPADCPPSLPRCVAFPFGGTDFMWCFPE